MSIHKEINMPNWCINTITIDADEDVKSKIKTLMLNAENEVDFNIIEPMPDDLQNENNVPGNYETPRWYTWSVENWGTKWNASSTQLLDNEAIVFQTAWQEPQAWFDTLNRRLRNDDIKGTLTMNYVEAGVADGGEIIYVDGLETMNRKYDEEELAKEMACDDNWVSTRPQE